MTSSDSPLVVCEKCRRIRLVVVATLLISAVLAGYLWGHYEQGGSQGVAGAALFFAVLSFLLVLAVEVVVTKVELQAKRLTLQVNEKIEEVRLLQDKNRSLERSISLLVRDDEEMRERLLSLSLHQGQDERKAEQSLDTAPPMAQVSKPA